MRSRQTLRHQAIHWSLVWLPLLLSLQFLLAAAIEQPQYVSASADVASGMASTVADGCVGPVAGQHIYDCAHLLTPSEVGLLEAKAAAVDHAGAPAVVYLQARNATAKQALQDAIDLMNRWHVESRPGARDGFVMFFDLQPGNLRHGEVALYAGAKHTQRGGHLPIDELTRIRTDVMTPLLASGQTAAGIAAGLDMVASDLRYGPPPPPAYQTVAAAIGGIPLSLVALLFAGVVALLWVRLARRAPMGGETALQPVASPSDLLPALAGALVKGRVSDLQIEATILDFARRGFLVIEPLDKNHIRMRLLAEAAGLTGYEQEVWNGLDQGAGAERTLSGADIAALRRNWSWPKTLLRRELDQRGWYDTEGAARRRRPLYIAGALGWLGAAAAVALILLSKEGWAGFGLVIFLGAGTAAFIRAYLAPDTTVEGAFVAASWRAYAQTLKARAYEPNLDTDLPYIVALGLIGSLGPRLKAASEQGYAPAWFRSDGDQRAPASGFYPYWVVIHSSMAPTSMSGGSAAGGYSGGGAAGGGGGSAGSF